MPTDDFQSANETEHPNIDNEEESERDQAPGPSNASSKPKKSVKTMNLPKKSPTYKVPSSSKMNAQILNPIKNATTQKVSS